MQNNYFISFTDNGLIVNNQDAFTERIIERFTVCMVDIHKKQITLYYKDITPVTFNIDVNARNVDAVIGVLRDYLSNTDDSDLNVYNFRGLYDENTSLFYSPDDQDYMKYMNIFNEGNRFRDESRIVKINQEILDIKDSIDILGNKLQEQKDLLSELSRKSKTDIIKEINSILESLSNSNNLLTKSIKTLENKVTSLESDLRSELDKQNKKIDTLAEETENILKIMADSIRRTINIGNILESAEDIH